MPNLFLAQTGVPIAEESKKIQKKYRKAIERLNKGDTEKALSELLKLHKENPLILEIIGSISGIYFELQNYDEAEKFLVKTMELDENQGPAYLFALGNIQRLNKNYIDASLNYAKFLRSEDKNKSRRENAKKYLKQSQFAAWAVENPVPLSPIKLNSAINTNNSEYLPAITADEQFIIFTRRVENQEDFYISEKLLNGFDEAKPLKELNSPYNEGAHTISPDGNTIIYTVCNSRVTMGSCDLYQAYKKDGRWTNPQNLGPTINSISWDAQPSLSSNGQKLYFSSKRKGGQGGSDIYVSHKSENGSWSTPENLGPIINSEGNEESPFIHPDNHSLYFRSDYYPGMGGFDIFFTKFKNGKWNDPENIGYPINTTGDEGALFVKLDGKTAYYAMSNTEDESNIDIYEIILPEKVSATPTTYIRTNVYDGDSGDKLSKITLDIIDLETGESYWQSLDYNNEIVCIPLGTNYSFYINAPGYVFHSEHLSLSDIFLQVNPYELEISLIPVIFDEQIEELASKPVVLKNIFFETGSFKLLESSFIEIDRLAELLTEHSSLKIRIIGHTDNVGEEIDNQILSENRAKAVYMALLDRNINVSRLEFSGMGESSPIASNNSEEGRQANRRTEFIIIGD